MPGPGRPRTVEATAPAVPLTPKPEVEAQKLTLEGQHQKRTEIMNQIKDDLWYERQWDSAMALQVLREKGFDCPAHSIQARQQVIKAVEIDHNIDVAASEREIYQRSLRERGWWIYEQFGIEYLTQPTCEWARFQRWCTHDFIRLSLSFRKQEITGQEYIEQTKEAYKTMNDFQATYWDKLRQDRVELEYQKWLFAARRSVHEQELPVNMVWDIEGGEVILSAPEATSAGRIKQFMKDECHFPEEDASNTQQWIARKVGSSKLIFGLSPEHRELLLQPQTPPPSEGSETEAGASGAINDDEGGVTEEELSPANIPPASRIIHGGLQPSKQHRARKKLNAKRQPPLPNKDPWALEWDDMTDAQKARMRDIHYGENDEYHRPPKKFAPGNASNNPIDLDQTDQSKEPAGQQGRSGAAATPEIRSKTSGEPELSDNSEATSTQQGQHEAAAAQSTKDHQPIENSGSTGSNTPLMIGPNGNGDDDGSKPPSQSGGTTSNGHYKQKSVVNDDDDNDSTALDDVEDKWLDPEVEARVMGSSSGATSQRTHEERGPENEGIPSQSPEPAAAIRSTAETIAQSARVKKVVLFRAPIIQSSEATSPPPERPQLGTFSDAPNSDIFRQQCTNVTLPVSSYNSDAGLNLSSRMDPRLGTVVRPSKIERPRIGPRPDNMNQRLEEAVRRASQTPALSGNGFTPINGPDSHEQPPANMHRPNAPVTQTKHSGTPVSQSASLAGAPPSPKVNDQATGILVRNPDGTVTLAPSSLKRRRSQASQIDENKRQRLLSSNGNHLNQQISPPESSGSPARHPRSATSTSTRGRGVPMIPQRSQPGFNNAPRHPQQQGQIDETMTLPMQHGSVSQRSNQGFGNQARSNGYQNPNTMHQVNSMNFSSSSGNTGSGFAQIQNSQFGSSGHLSMMINQQNHYAGHSSTDNGYDIERCPLSSGYSGLRGSQPSQKPDTMTGSELPNMLNNMKEFASPHMQNFMTNGYGMAQSSLNIHNSMHGNRMTQQPSGHRRHGPSMGNLYQGRPTGMRYGQEVPTKQRRSQSEIRHMRQDQPGYNSLVSTLNTPHNNIQWNNSLEASRVPRPVDGQNRRGLPTHGSQAQPGAGTAKNQQTARTTVGKSPSMDLNQRQQGPKPIAPTKGQPNEMRRGLRRPRRSQPQQSQPQIQNTAPVPAQPPTQPASPRPWVADQSVYKSRPVTSAHGQLYFGQPPPVLRHVLLPPTGLPSGTGSLQNIEPIEQNYTIPNMQVRTTEILEHQLSVARDLGLSLQPPPAAPVNQQPNMNNPAAVLARQQNAPQSKQVSQQESVATNPFIDPSSLSISLAPETQVDGQHKQHGPTAPRPQATQQAQDNGHESYGDGMGLENWDDLLNPPASQATSQLEFPQTEDEVNIILDPADDLFGGVNFDEFRELV